MSSDASDYEHLSLSDIRQMVAGEHSSQTKITVGFHETDAPEVHKEGDVWTDRNGDTWEQKNGYKMRVTKILGGGMLDETRIFTRCPKEKCECVTPNRLDKKFASKTGMCTDCVQKEEYEHKRNGTYDIYAKQKMLQNARAWLREAQQDKDAIVNELSKLEFADESGKNDKWHVGITREQLIEKIENEFREFEENFIKRLEKECATNSETQ